eukprot:10734430-Alexandrium_andersonii.AAC.1
MAACASRGAIWPCASTSHMDSCPSEGRLNHTLAVQRRRSGPSSPTRIRRLALARPRSTNRPISRRAAVATAGATPVRATAPA